MDVVRGGGTDRKSDSIRLGQVLGEAWCLSRRSVYEAQPDHLAHRLRGQSTGSVTGTDIGN